MDYIFNWKKVDKQKVIRAHNFFHRYLRRYWSTLNPESKQRCWTVIHALTHAYHAGDRARSLVGSYNEMTGKEQKIVNRLFKNIL